MTMNDLERRMATILPYFAQFGSFRGQLRKLVISHQQNFLPRNVIKYTNYDC